MIIKSFFDFYQAPLSTSQFSRQRSENENILVEALDEVAFG